jgi:hypothetical protein
MVGFRVESYAKPLICETQAPASNKKVVALQYAAIPWLKFEGGRLLPSIAALRMRLRLPDSVAIFEISKQLQ